jgi:Uma2 family endonuclease
MSSELAAPRQSRPPTRHRLTAKEFHRMAEAGILHENDRIELVEGELIDMAPIGGNHAGIVAQLNAWLTGAAAGRYIVFPQNSLALSEHSEPQPDLTLLKPRDDYYRSALPTPSDVLLLIEVSDTTVEFDRNTKAPLYARSGIPEVWLVNLRDQVVEVLREPTAQGYVRNTRVVRGQRLASLAFPDLVLPVDDLLT